ncbi:MAG: hypothetical protein HYS13_21845 [Planctomycetia bacterium]|nr:hypothetical protein [Planctomycetia bacterium]
MNDSLQPQTPPAPRRSLFRFSLKTLLLVVTLIAVYLAGRGKWQPETTTTPTLAGTWQATFPAGAKWTVTVKDLGQGKFLIGGMGVLSGVYKHKDDQLVVVTPSDPRMTGLVWTWDDNRWTLSAETPGTPTGSSYVGTILAPLPVGTGVPVATPATGPIARP